MRVETEASSREAGLSVKDLPFADEKELPANNCAANGSDRGTQEGGRKMCERKTKNTYCHVLEVCLSG